MFDYTKAPENMQGGLRRYFERGVAAGGCLMAILENDLMQAFARADNETMRNMHGIVQWLYNEAPIGSYGSKELVRKWIEKGGMGVDS